MSGAAVIAVVLFVFFIVGVGTGVIAVVALSARRAHKAVRRIGPAAPPSKRWPYSPETDPDDNGLGEPPWWHARGDD